MPQLALLVILCSSNDQMQRYFLYAFLCVHCLVPGGTNERLFAHEVHRSFSNLVTPRVNNFCLTFNLDKISMFDHFRESEMKIKVLRRIFVLVFLSHFATLIHFGLNLFSNSTLATTRNDIKSLTAAKLT